MQGWLNWLHNGLQTQRSKFKPRLGQISMNQLDKLKTMNLWLSN